MTRMFRSDAGTTAISFDLIMPYTERVGKSRREFISRPVREPFTGEGSCQNGASCQRTVNALERREPDSHSVGLRIIPLVIYSISPMVTA